MKITCGQHQLDLSEPKVMAVLNVTPDSFSDGGKSNSIQSALKNAGRMLAEGADIIDVGGESTRPGAAPVSVSEEMARVIPVVDALVKEFNCIVSVDTSKPEVMQAAIEAGAGIINDVTAVADPKGYEVLSAFKNVAICIMHMQGQPRTMQQKPIYGDVSVEVSEFLVARANDLKAHGVDAGRIILDPGFGFGKTLEHNYSLARTMPELVSLGYPVLVGVSRKSMLGDLLSLPVDQRDPASAMLAVQLVVSGARIVRAHHVSYTKQAIKLAMALA